MGLKLSRSQSRQANGRSARWERQISSLARIWMAPWLSSPVSESVRAATVASSKASALRHATAARLAIASSVSMSSRSTGRMEKKASDSAPRSAPFQNIGTDTAVLTCLSGRCRGRASRPGSRS